VRCCGMALCLFQLLNNHILAKIKWNRRFVALDVQTWRDCARFGVEIESATLTFLTFLPLDVIYVQPLVPRCF